MSPRAASPYRKVYTQVWTSASFRALSSAAQTLWLLLLTGPQTSCIPGVMATSAAALSVTLGWTIEMTRIHVLELVEEGMAEVDPAGMVWLPKAFGYDPPANPNVVRSWRTVWSMLPACPLKRRVWQQLHDQLAQRGSGFLDAFLAVCPEPPPPSSRRSPGTSGDGQIAPQIVVSPGSLETVPETQSPEAGSQKPEGTHTQSACACEGTGTSDGATLPPTAEVTMPPHPSAPTVPVPPSPEPTPLCPVSVPPEAEPTVPVVVLDAGPVPAEASPPATERKPDVSSEPPATPPAPYVELTVAPTEPAPPAPEPTLGLGPEARAILTELERHPSLAPIATPRHAERAAGLVIPLGCLVADVVDGLRDLAAQALMSDAPSQAWLEKSVATFAKTAAARRRRDAGRTSSAPRAVVPSPRPGPTLADLKAARAAERAADPPVSPEQMLRNQRRLAEALAGAFAPEVPSPEDVRREQKARLRAWAQANGEAW